MSLLRRFKPEDIGVELFPAITSGLYRNPLDALREYVQNAIDAKAKRIEITLNPDVVSVRDDGTGMTPAQARDAIRLGISEKNPVEHVGFRGIGIYSGFHLCDRLEIHTLRRRNGVPSVITVDFEAVQDMLRDEEARRREKLDPQLHLALMLSQAVTVEREDDSPLTESGTLVMLVGLRPEVYKRLNSESEVTRYLQDTVPLPFRPEFKFAKEISAKFDKEDYRMVELVLSTPGKPVAVHRPYANDIFHHEGRFPPEFIDLISPATGTCYGFAWVCFNDARKVLPHTELRGLLVKKYGFSIGDRNYLEPYFRRTIFHKRITGEVIVQHDDLIPNAARSEFESTPLRTDFQLALTDLVQQVSGRANDIQQELKAREELDQVSPRVYEILKEVASSRRDVDHLLDLNVELVDLYRRLRTHKDEMVRLDRPRYEKANKVLGEAKRTIGELLSKEPKRRPRKLAEKAARRGREAPSEEETVHRHDRPRTLMEVLESLDIVVTIPMKTAIAHIDEAILKPRLSESDYEKELEALRDHLEESV